MSIPMAGVIITGSFVAARRGIVESGEILHSLFLQTREIGGVKGF